MKKVLIANRGEIAVRIARACRDYGVRSVAVYADPDADGLHTRLANEAWALDGTSSDETYLDARKLLEIARRSGADAVHPGYGFLSERADFARAVIAAGLVWIGPPPAAMEALGEKVAARRIAQKVGAPLVAGTEGAVHGVGDVLAFVREHGLPVAIKAAFGGGGRGMKVVRDADEVAELYEAAVREATAAFGRGECFVECFLDRPRHVEAQVMGDTHGHVVVVGTRDCSLQRRNQKLVEEAPAPFLTDAQRGQIHDAARAICAEAGYVSAGTVEFLLGPGGELTFLEVNTRLQVEHGVTEESTGVDLVLEQLRIADGLPLSFLETPAARACSMEFRINAEDPGRGFLPVSGVISRFDAPDGPGIRVDSGVSAGAVVTHEFDSLMAKLIVSAPTRQQVLKRARRALGEFQIDGVASTLSFHQTVVIDPAFIGEQSLQVHTRWIEDEAQGKFTPSARASEPAYAQPLWRTFIELDGQRVSLGLPAGLRGTAKECNHRSPERSQVHLAEHDDILVPSSGCLLKWHCEDGASVSSGEVVATLESMKMEISIVSPANGLLRQRTAPGDDVAAGLCIGWVERADV